MISLVRKMFLLIPPRTGPSKLLRSGSNCGKSLVGATRGRVKPGDVEPGVAARAGNFAGDDVPSPHPRARSVRESWIDFPCWEYLQRAPSCKAEAVSTRLARLRPSPPPSSPRGTARPPRNADAHAFRAVRITATPADAPAAMIFLSPS